jgi:hypothetical protein
MYKQHDQSYIGKGKVFIQPAGGEMRFLSNATSMAIAITEEEKKLKDYTAQGGGNRNVLSRIDEIKINFELTDISPENIALALAGTVDDVEAGTVEDEAVTAVVGAISTLAYVGATDVTVTNEDGTETYALNTDYEVTGAGISVVPGSTILSGETLLVSYSYGAQKAVEALTDSSREYRIVFDGLNEAQSGSPRVVDFYRLKFSPTSGMGYIGDDFDSLTLSATLLRDSTKPSGKSAYFKDVQVAR